MIILTKNEEAAIRDCIAAVPWAAEVFVVDSSSTDKTAQIARQMGATMVSFSWNGEYPKKKQWALDNVPAKHDWVLLLDADEVAQPELPRHLAEVIDETSGGGPYGAADIEFDYEWQGRLLKHGHRVVKRSLVQRTRCRFPVVDDLSVASMWEVEGHYQPQTHLPVRRIPAGIIHRDPDPASQWFSRHNRYSDWEAHVVTSGQRAEIAGARSRGGRLFARVPFKAVAFFLYSFVVQRGFLDGRAGFDYALAQSFYYWQIELKIREIQRTAEGIERQ
ncbi:glycosyltransferase family 2 protein [Pseudonocardia oroxyli]|uniref:glycosyltransferase family 2 protein n=1 Tax=Pseudonocardia oroxyli TaxID=366584 RepID=UPI001C40AF73|nr:glycosyltransferase family 2 protein [Pseudonocardia oroxyli]